MSLDALEASLAASGIKPPAVEVSNAPPQVIVSYVARDPRADRRRAGVEARARATRASSA